MLTISNRWDPDQYARFSDHRSRPFFDLVGRVDADPPRLVVDLGCGNGPLTLWLATHWSAARVVGVDHSPQMLEAARGLDTSGRVEWVEADLTTWDPASLGAPPDVIVTSAALQWVPGHLDLLGGWTSSLAAGGWLALQVPNNLDSPSHALMREVAASHPRAADLLDALSRLGVGSPADYLAALSTAGLETDVWETTYQHVLDPQGRQDNPVLEWVSSTGLRPVLDTLTDEAERKAFLEVYAGRLRTAYPRTAVGVVFPFRRLFAVGHRPATGPRPEGALRLGHVQVAMPAGTEAAMRGFYAGVLGLRELPKPAALAARGGVWFAVGGQELHCGVEESFAPARKAHPCLVVGDVDAMAARVAGAGGEVRWDERITGVRRFHTDDPVGNRVEVEQG